MRSIQEIEAAIVTCRLRRMYGGSFTEKVLYIYRKQIEEADLLVISKSDVLESERLNLLHEAISREYPGKEILAVSARNGSNIEKWFSRITSSEQVARTAMEVDYAVYADREALLGWLNCTILISSEPGVDADQLLKALARCVLERLRAVHGEVAHLKMTLGPDMNLAGEVAAVSLVRNDFVPELTLRLEEPEKAGQLILSLRAEPASDVLGAAVREGLAEVAVRFPGVRTTLDHLEHFRPGKPTPTHRIQTLLP